jgi:hypothetical protein
VAAGHARRLDLEERNVLPKRLLDQDPEHVRTSR